MTPGHSGITRAANTTGMIPHSKKQVAFPNLKGSAPLGNNSDLDAVKQLEGNDKRGSTGGPPAFKNHIQIMQNPGSERNQIILVSNPDIMPKRGLGPITVTESPVFGAAASDLSPRANAAGKKTFSGLGAAGGSGKKRSVAQGTHVPTGPQISIAPALNSSQPRGPNGKGSPQPQARSGATGSAECGVQNERRQQRDVSGSLLRTTSSRKVGPGGLAAAAAADCQD